MKYCIGSVIFAVDSNVPCGFQGIHHGGQERVKLLQLVRDGKELPDGLFLIADNRGWRRITPDDIDWTTSRLVRGGNDARTT